MSTRVIVFAGAGASFGVSNKYPMTKQFFDGLPKLVVDSPLFAYVTGFLQSKTGKTSLDIEDVLWALDDILASVAFANRQRSTPHILHHLFASNQVHAVTKIQPGGAEVLAQLDGLRGHATKLRDKINDEVYKYYAVLPTEDELLLTWIPLLKWLRGLNPESVNLVTTNYDKVIESALTKVDGLRIDTGTRAAIEVNLDLSLWDRSRSIDGGLLTKLHGSVDWRFADPETRKVVRWGHPEHDGRHEARGIIYPGFKGMPKDEPFKSFHDFFELATARATHILFIGFAFRDDYINGLLTQAISPGARVAVIDPADALPSLPFLESAVHVRMGFGGASITMPHSGSPPWLNDLQAWLA